MGYPDGYLSCQSSRIRRRRQMTRACEILVNFMVTGASHVYLKLTRCCPARSSVGHELNKGQRELVRESWARVGSFRRLAGEVVCGDKLAAAAASLESLARALGQLDITPYYRNCMGNESQETFVGACTAAKEKACPFVVVARQVGFPSELLDFDPRPFLSDRSRRAYEDPDELLLPED